MQSIVYEINLTGIYLRTIEPLCTKAEGYTFHNTSETESYLQSSCPNTTEITPKSHISSFNIHLWEKMAILSYSSTFMTKLGPRLAD
jgi:hypothetical protein